MNHFTEISLVLFWLAYFGLHAWLLRTPPGEAQDADGHRLHHDPLQGETP